MSSDVDFCRPAFVDRHVILLRISSRVRFLILTSNLVVSPLLLLMISSLLCLTTSSFISQDSSGNGSPKKIETGDVKQDPVSDLVGRFRTYKSRGRHF